MKRLNQTESLIFMIFLCVLCFQRQAFLNFYSNSSLKLHNEIHIIKNTVMKQSIGLNGYLKPKQTQNKHTHTHTHTHTEREREREREDHDGHYHKFLFSFSSIWFSKKGVYCIRSVCQQWMKLLYLDQYILFKHMNSSCLGELVCSGQVQQFQIQMQAFLLRFV